MPAAGSDGVAHPPAYYYGSGGWREGEHGRLLLWRAARLGYTAAQLSLALQLLPTDVLSGSRIVGAHGPGTRPLKTTPAATTAVIKSPVVEAGAEGLEPAQRLVDESEREMQRALDDIVALCVPPTGTPGLCPLDILSVLLFRSRRTSLSVRHTGA